MDNETKLTKEQINSIKQELSEKKGDINPGEFMNRHLSEKQREAFNSVINDPEKMKSLLNSPLAQKLMERFNKPEKE